MSFQSQLLYFIMKNRHLLQLRLKAETWDEKTSIPAFRAMCEEGKSSCASWKSKRVLTSSVQGLTSVAQRQK